MDHICGVQAGDAPLPTDDSWIKAHPRLADDDAVGGLRLAVSVLGAAAFAALVYACQFVSARALWSSAAASYLPSLAYLSAVIGALTVVVLLALPRLRRVAQAHELQARSAARMLWPLLVVAVLLIGSGITMDDEGMGWPTGASILLALVLGATSGAWEEAWRAITLSILGGRRRPWLAIVTTSVLFGAFHMTAISPFSTIHAIAATFLGIAFSVAILRGARLLHVMAMHAIYDVFLLSFLTEDYLEIHLELDAASLSELGPAAFVAPTLLLIVAVFAIRSYRKDRPGLAELESTRQAQAHMPFRAYEFVPVGVLMLAAAFVAIDWFMMDGPVSERALARCVTFQAIGLMDDNVRLTADEWKRQELVCSAARDSGKLSIQGNIQGK